MLDRQVLRPRRRVRIDIGRVIRWIAVLAAIAAFAVDRHASRLEAEQARAEARAQVAIEQARAQLAAQRTHDPPSRSPHQHGYGPIVISRACIDNPLAKDCM